VSQPDEYFPLAAVTGKASEQGRAEIARPSTRERDEFADFYANCDGTGRRILVGRRRYAGYRQYPP
jgi:hypothetical protein